MGICWDYFLPDEFDPNRQDEIIHLVRSDPNLSREQKKLLILCWFQVVYGGSGPPEDIQRRTSQAIKAMLASSPFRSLEDMLS